MGRRRRNEGLVDVLVLLPWQVSAGLACASFAAMRWIVPSMFARNPILAGLAGLSQSMAWLPLVVFGFLGLVAFGRAKTQSTGATLSKEGRSPRKSGSEPAIHILSTEVQIESGNANKLETGWGRSGNSASNTEKEAEAFDAWSLRALRALEWKRFELLCAKYYELVGFKTETIRCGADGGIDVKLFKFDPDKPIAIVQCKAWNTSLVGVNEIRELLGVMTHEKVGRGIFLITGSFSKDALNFGAVNPIQLLDGEGFLKKILELTSDQQNELLGYAFEGDYKTPTCASCGIKMIRRESKRGLFWGCLNYPRCKSTFAMKV
jgi:restriction system protein